MLALDPPLAAASLSGQSDASWALELDGIVGGAFLGGVAIDAPTQAAARGAVLRGRDEFLTDDAFAFIETQLERLEGCALTPGVNVRAASATPITQSARICERHETILEVNAHCRQPECTAIGCGERLCEQPARLAGFVEAAARTGATVSVKVRAELDGVDLAALARRLEAAGADAMHIDAMDSRPVIADVAAACDLTVIANNGVRTADDVVEYLGYGADAVSVGRPSTDPEHVARIATAIGADGIGF